MFLDDRVKQIRAWANQEKILDTHTMEDIANEICSEAYELKCRDEHPSKEQVGSLFSLLIIYTNLAGLTLEECLCYTVETIQSNSCNITNRSRTVCHECGNPNCFDDGK